VRDKKPMSRKEKRKPKSIVISLLALSLLLIYSAVAFPATIAGVITQLSGPLLARKADGSTRILSINSIVEPGDILVTEKKTYAQIKFTDNGVVILRPNTQFKISDYHFDGNIPEKDSAIFDVVRGALRSITGFIGKRGNPSCYQMITPTAVAGVRGTTYECKICQGNCGLLPDGLYIYVLEGIVNVANSAGSQDVGTGQYIYVASWNSMPVILNENPGIDFTLPSSFEDLQEEGEESPGEDRGCIVR
jgi:hypothetical protein